jgi:hypothetical protein
MGVPVLASMETVVVGETLPKKCRPCLTKNTVRQAKDRGPFPMQITSGTVEGNGAYYPRYLRNSRKRS